MGVCTAGKLLDYDIKTTFYCGCLTKYHSDRINEIIGHKKANPVRTRFHQSYYSYRYRPVQGTDTVLNVHARTRHFV